MGQNASLSPIRTFSTIKIIFYGRIFLFICYGNIAFITAFVGHGGFLFLVEKVNRNWVCQTTFFIQFKRPNNLKR